MKNASKKTKTAPKWMIEAAKLAGFDTVETRNADSADFREVSVWRMREALEAAFNAGKASR